MVVEPQPTRLLEQVDKIIRHSHLIYEKNVVKASLLKNLEKVLMEITPVMISNYLQTHRIN